MKTFSNGNKVTAMTSVKLEDEKAMLSLRKKNISMGIREKGTE